MKVVEKKLVDDGLGETEGARRATGVSPSSQGLRVNGKFFQLPCFTPAVFNVGS